MKSVIAILALLYSNIIFATDRHEINSLFVESTARYIYEAELQALHGGMLRAFYILSDKYRVDTSHLSTIPICALQSIFTVKEILNVRQTDYTYKANVSFQYNIENFKKVLYDYGDNDIRQQFFEYLVIPAFKLNTKIELHNNRIWFSKWSESKDQLLNNALLYMDSRSVLLDIGNTEQLQKLTYNNIADHVNDKLFRKILLVLCEYKTDIKTGEKHVVVK